MHRMGTKKTKRNGLVRGRWRVLYLTGCTIAITAGAQTGEWVERSELSSYVGPGFGAGGSHVYAGGSAGVSPSKYFLGVIDVSYMPLGSHPLRTNLFGTSQSHLYDFSFQGQILIPIKQRVQPYALLGAGVLYNTYRIPAVNTNGVAYLAGRSDTKFGFQTGGGARIFVTEGFGFRTEYRFTASSRNFNSLLFGVIYQFDGTWPFLSRRNQRRTQPR
jgi:Outer membrane protein beta-barrel domain